MSVAVLNPQDSLTPLPRLGLDRGHPSRVRQGRRRRSPTKTQNTSPPPRPAKALAVGEIRLLRRGEELKEAATKPKPPAAEPTPARAEQHRAAGPARKPPARRAPADPPRFDLPTGGVAGFYAGSAFVTSPPPSSLPVPAFCAKKAAGPPSVVHATSDLRKLLGIE